MLSSSQSSLSSSSSSSSSIGNERKSLNPELKKEIENKERKKYFESYIKIRAPDSISNRYSYLVYPSTHIIELPNHLLITDDKMTKDNCFEFSGISILDKESRNRINWIIPPSGARITAMARIKNFLVVGFFGKKAAPQLGIYDISNIHRIEIKKIINMPSIANNHNDILTHSVTSIVIHGNRIACVGYEDFKGSICDNSWSWSSDYSSKLKQHNYIDYFFGIWEVDFHELDKSVPKKVYTLPEELKRIVTFNEFDSHPHPLQQSYASCTLLHLSNGNLVVPRIGLFDINKLKPVNDTSSKNNKFNWMYESLNNPIIEIVSGKFFAKANAQRYSEREINGMGIYDITTGNLVDIINLGHITALTALKNGGFVCSDRAGDIQFWHIRNNKWICTKKENLVTHPGGYLRENHCSISTISVLHNNMILAITSSGIIYSTKRSIISTGYRRLTFLKKMIVAKKTLPLSESKEPVSDINEGKESLLSPKKLDASISKKDSKDVGEDQDDKIVFTTSPHIIKKLLQLAELSEEDIKNIKTHFLSADFQRTWKKISVNLDIIVDEKIELVEDQKKINSILSNPQQKDYYLTIKIFLRSLLSAYISLNSNAIPRRPETYSDTIAMCVRKSIKLFVPVGSEAVSEVICLVWDTANDWAAKQRFYDTVRQYMEMEAFRGKPVDYLANKIALELTIARQNDVNKIRIDSHKGMDFLDYAKALFLNNQINHPIRLLALSDFQSFQKIFTKKDLIKHTILELIQDIIAASQANIEKYISSSSGSSTSLPPTTTSSTHEEIKLKNISHCLDEENTEKLKRLEKENARLMEENARIIMVQKYLSEQVKSLTKKINGSDGKSGGCMLLATKDPSLPYDVLSSHVLDLKRKIAELNDDHIEPDASKEDMEELLNPHYIKKSH